MIQFWSALFMWWCRGFQPIEEQLHFTVKEFTGKDANYRMNKTDWQSWLPTWNLHKFTLRQNDSKKCCVRSKIKRTATFPMETYTEIYHKIAKKAIICLLFLSFSLFILQKGLYSLVFLCPRISSSHSLPVTPAALFSSWAWHSSSFSQWSARAPEALSVSSAGSPSPSPRFTLKNFESLSPLRHLISLCCPLLSSTICHLTTNLRDR